MIITLSIIYLVVLIVLSLIAGIFCGKVLEDDDEEQYFRRLCWGIVLWPIALVAVVLVYVAAACFQTGEWIAKRFKNKP